LVALAGAVALALSAGGCAFGPRALERTHGRYTEALRHVDEEQLLRNLVHLRYNETPGGLDVSSIAAQYELSAGAEARPFFIAPNPSNSNIIFRTFTSILPDVTLQGSNRPTVTFTPIDDSDAVQRFLTPVPVDTLALLSQTSWPVSSILRLYVERLNGVPNGGGAVGAQGTPVPDFARFQRVAQLIDAARTRDLLSLHAEERLTQVGGPLPAEAVTAAAAVEAAKNGLEYRRTEDGKTWILVRSQRRLVVDISPGAETSPEVVELTSLLNLVPGAHRYGILVGSGRLPDPQLFPGPPSIELHLLPRSTAQVWGYLANGVEVPAPHVSSGLVRLPVDAVGRPFDGRDITRGLFEVHAATGHKPPATAYVAVPYRGYWYYVDDRDEASKATFALMLSLSRLDFGRQRRNGGPALTLPVGR
jgi:hypothetical protein